MGASSSTECRPIQCKKLAPMGRSYRADALSAIILAA